MKALISIHDVMPETLDKVRGLIQQLQDNGHQAITLLVVPGRDWQAEDIRQLADWSAQGMELAAHGWHHKTAHVRGLWHRLHSALISRDVAEHLSLDAEGVESLMGRSAAWFDQQGLPAPSSYVPPAWALGALPKQRWSALPFRRIEVTRGLLNTRSGQLEPLPLVGFEADTHLRATFLRGWNRFQARKAQRLGRPLRIGIHPQDGDLLLADDLMEFMRGGWASRRMDDPNAVS